MIFVILYKLPNYQLIAYGKSKTIKDNHSEDNLDVILHPLPASLNNELNQSESRIETSNNSNNASDTANAAQVRVRVRVSYTFVMLFCIFVFTYTIIYIYYLFCCCVNTLIVT